MINELLLGFAKIGIYFVICASIAFIFRILIKIPTEIFRKILHLILVGSSFIWTFGFDTWWVSALAAVIFAIVVYPILMIAERIKGYSNFVTERKLGELKQSLLIVFAMFALVISFCWGIFGKKELVTASILSWGLGDAAAALIGKKFGKHHLSGKYIEGTKSIEGSMAMFTFSFIALLTVFFITNIFSPIEAVFAAAITAVVSALSELFSKNGMDTIICPLANTIILIPLSIILGNA